MRFGRAKLLLSLCGIWFGQSLAVPEMETGSDGERRRFHVVYARTLMGRE